jgi:capsular polysaccharide biosynthesis protein
VALAFAEQLPTVAAAQLLSDERRAVAALVERSRAMTMAELAVAVDPALGDHSAEIALRAVDESVPPEHPATLCVRTGAAAVWGRGFVPILADGRYLGDAARNIGALRRARVPIDETESISELPASVRAGGTAVVIGTTTAANHFHWLFESVGRIGVLAACLPRFADELGEAAYLVPPLTAFQRETLSAAGVPGERLREITDELLVFDRVIVPSRGLGRVHSYSPVAARFLRSLAPSRGRYRRVYISRRGALKRRIVNEPALVSALARRGFVEVRTEDLSFAQELELFAATEVLISAHGAGLANQVFMPPGGRVIEIQPPSPGNAAAVVYWALASTVGHGYGIYVAAADPPGAELRNAANADIRVDVDAFMALLDRALG